MGRFLVYKKNTRFYNYPMRNKLYVSTLKNSGVYKNYNILQEKTTTVLGNFCKNTDTFRADSNAGL